ncbi:unnamed protein product [Peronospora destructor]|uniref:Protein phosphatase 2C n=1 Tax=Peronospora destructor TaxID=86335 RepID=A0AAV0UG52_9STRA|nr:unnamed protein product [Peronospora destructor]
MSDTQDVQTLKMKVVRKHEHDHERRRPTTLCHEPPQSDVRKTTSFLRARTSGVNRLLRLTTSSTGGISVNGYSTNSNKRSKSKSAPSSKSTNQQDDELDMEQTEAVNGNGAELLLSPIEPELRLKSTASSTGVADEKERLSLYVEQQWTHVVLKMTAFSEEDVVTSFFLMLMEEVSFRVGKSDFIVTAFHEPLQTLEVSALSGKLAGTEFTIGREGAGIGRSAENKIHTGDGELSRKHAAIWFDELTNQFYLVDLNSTNGTFMKLVGSYQEPYRLEIGDDLLVAQTCLTVNRFDVGAHADMGARKHMEDAHTIIQDLCIESLSRLGLHPQSYFAVYDGHGGEEASSYLSEVLHHNIIDTFFMKKVELKLLINTSPEELQSMITKRLTDAFEKTDEEFLNESERPQAGSTATTVFVAGKYMFVSNVGDSRTVLSCAGKAKRLSNDHKPSRQDEAQRIRDTGGFVIHGRIMGELAVSRAFGDAPFKTFDLPEPPKEDVDSKPRSDYDSQELPVNPNDILKGPLVIPTPEFTITELTDDCEFVMLASDGLYDVLKDQEAVDFMRQKIAQLGDVQRAVEAIVEHAIVHQHSTDNVTCVVVMFKEPKDLK